MHVSCPRLMVWPLFTLKPCMQIIYLFQGSVPKSFQPFWSQCHYGRNFQIVSKNYETLNKKNIIQCVIKRLEMMKTTFWVKVEFVCFTMSVIYTRIIFGQRLEIPNKAQRPRMDLNKKSLPRPKTTTAWKPIPHRSNISKN